nr:PH domain-containing protein [Gordonia sp. (in: high G+C Gram-positive bacteria)]
MTQPDPQTPRVDGPGDWHRLSAWMMLEETPGRVPQFLGVVVGLASLFLGIPGIVPIVVGALAAVVAAVPIWLATTYQVTDQHVRVRSGVIRRKAATA